MFRPRNNFPHIFAFVSPTTVSYMNIYLHAFICHTAEYSWKYEGRQKVIESPKFLLFMLHSLPFNEDPMYINCVSFSLFFFKYIKYHQNVSIQLLLKYFHTHFSFEIIVDDCVFCNRTCCPSPEIVLDVPKFLLHGIERRGNREGFSCYIHVGWAKDKVDTRTLRY